MSESERDSLHPDWRADYRQYEADLNNPDSVASVHHHLDEVLRDLLEGDEPQTLADLDVWCGKLHAIAKNLQTFIKRRRKAFL